MIEKCLAVAPGEDVLVIVDERTRAIGEALRERAAAAGADAVLAVMDERATDGTEPPRRSPPRCSACDVVHRADQPIAQPHERAQGGQRRRRARRDDAGRHRGDARARDGRRLRPDGGPLARRRGAARRRDASARVTCPRGTDFTLDLSGRAGISDDGELTTAGAFGNLPCGEGFIAPAERRRDDRRLQPGAARG